MAAQDRRVRRTRKLLHEAFISLVLEQGYEKTTVQDILDRADVGRSAFYVHFSDKQALLIASFDAMREQLQREITDATPPGGSIDAATPPGRPLDIARPAAFIFDHAYRHQRVYRALCHKDGGNVVHKYLHGLIGELLLQQLGPRLAHTGSEMPADVAAEFYAAAALGLLTWWIDHDFCRGPAWLTAMYRQLATTALGAVDQLPSPDPPPPAAAEARPRAGDRRPTTPEPGALPPHYHQNPPPTPTPYVKNPSPKTQQHRPHSTASPQRHGAR